LSEILCRMIPNESTSSPQSHPAAASPKTNSSESKKNCSAPFSPERKVRTSPFSLKTEADQNPNDPEITDRLWKFLTSNITRAVDELYFLCEESKSKERCCDSIEVFIQCKRDFEKLIERIDDQERFEMGDQRRGIGWEVRKPVASGRILQVSWFKNKKFIIADDPLN
jgi:hypothetical protein